MNLTPDQLQLSSFSGLDEVPAETLESVLPQIIGEASPASLQNFTDLLLDRALRLLRQGSRDEILAEALVISRGVSGELGHALRARNAEIFGAWSLLDDLLAEAGRRSDRAAVPSILLATRGHGQAILELLAGEGRAVPRSDIRKRLDLAESQLSHLLRDLEEADLIVRVRIEKGREVLVELGPVGREVAKGSILPAWVEKLTAFLQGLAAGERPERETVARELASAGAPSQLAADRLADALARVTRADAERQALAALFVQKVTDDVRHLQLWQDYLRGRPPRSLFSPS